MLPSFTPSFTQIYCYVFFVYAVMLINTDIWVICYTVTKLLQICIVKSVYFSTQCALFYTPLGSQHFQALRDTQNGNFPYHHSALYLCGFSGNGNLLLPFASLFRCSDVPLFAHSALVQRLTLQLGQSAMKQSVFVHLLIRLFVHSENCRCKP